MGHCIYYNLMGSLKPILILGLLCQPLLADEIKVLFLGGGGGGPESGHNGRLNHKKLIPHFLRAGIDLTYSNSHDDLNKETLSKFDSVVLYTGGSNSKPERVTALTTYVEGGGGLVAVHHTCGAFEGTEPFVKLVGGEFARHGSGYFTANHVKGKEDHPALGGIDEFETWDETYVHKNLNDDRTNLQTRDEKGRPEPWTWVRVQGKGKVFYTAYGHDGRTWEQPEFQKMITSAAIWVSKRKPTPNKDIPVLTYRKDTDKNLHNHEKRQDEQVIQNYLTPEESARCLVLPDGFKAELIAHEPDIKNPIDITWDDRGRMYVAETNDYPQIKKNGSDRIILCEDTDKDGKMDKFTTFAEGFSLHTGITWVNGGLIVAQAPNMYFIKDTTGDDKADHIEIINKNWGLNDLHGGPSNMKYSFNNMIYGAIGGGGYSSEKGYFSGGVWKMNIDGSNVEYVTSLSGNSWGLTFSEDNEMFGNSANKVPAKHVTVPYSYFENVGLKKEGSNHIFDYITYYPLTTTRQGDHFGTYTSAAGFELYTARSFPEEYWNKSAFVGGPTGKLLGHFQLEEDRQGSYIARNKESFVASFDEHTAPISGRTGPDGALYMLDWSNLIMLHGGETNNPLRDKKHGRIYRITHKGGVPSKMLNLHKAKTLELIEALTHDNMFWRMMAQQKIVQQKRTDAIPALIELAKDPGEDAIRSNPGVIHALWSLHGLGQLDGSNKKALKVAQDALKHRSAAVRKNAVRVLPPSAENTELLSAMLNEKDANTLRFVLLSLSTMPPSQDVGNTLHQMKAEITKKRHLMNPFNIAFVRHGGSMVADFVAKLPKRDRAAEETMVEEKPQLENIMKNPSFEELQKGGSKDGIPVRWNFKVHRKEAKVSLDTEVVRTGKHSARIESATGGGAEVLQVQSLEPGTYLLSAWVKTKDVEGKNGVMLRAAGRGLDDHRSAKIKGTHDEWQNLQLNFRVKERSGVLLFCLFGAWDTSTGTVWYDDVELFQLTSEKVVEKVASVESILATQAFSESPENLISLVSQLNTKLSKASFRYMEGIAEVRDMKFTKAQVQKLTELAAEASKENKMPLAIFSSQNNIDIGLNELANSIQGFTPEIIDGDATKGAELAKACIVCHSPDFSGELLERAPALSQLSKTYLQTQMQKFKHNVRGNDVTDADAYTMGQLMKEFSVQDMANLTAHIKSFTPEAKKPTLEGDPVNGKKLYATCMACHQADGHGNEALKAPSLVGQHDQYIFRQLVKFKAGIRGSGPGDKEGQMMQMTAKVLKNEQEMRDLAAYISTLSIEKKEQEK